MKKKTIIAVICAKNEDDTILDVVKNTKKYVDEVVVIDDGSNNPIKINMPGVHVVRNRINIGKGFSMRLGAAWTADYHVFVDGDGQHNPEYIPRMIKLMNTGEFDMIKAYRCYYEMPIIKKIGNKGLSMIFQFLYGMFILDSQCGMKMYNKEGLKTLQQCKEDGYEIEIEQLINAKKAKIRMHQFPINVNYITKETRPIHGLHIGWTMLKWRFMRW